MKHGNLLFTDQPVLFVSYVTFLSLHRKYIF